MAQQELLEVPPERHVVLPLSLRDSAGWWGVDVSTSRFNVAWVDQQGRRGVHSVRLGAASDNVGERLTRFARRLRELVDAMLADGCPVPAVVFVEQPAALGGKGGSKPIMWYTVAVATQTVYERAKAHAGHVPYVATVPSATWKLSAVGRGNIKKPPRPPGTPPPPPDAYPVWQWARTLGLAADGSWDDADAMGIAECARRTIGIRQ